MIKQFLFKCLQPGLKLLGGAAIALALVGWVKHQAEKQVIAQCENNQNQVIMQSLMAAKVQTQEILAFTKEVKKQQEEGLSDDCQKIYNLDLRTCRSQLHKR